MQISSNLHSNVSRSTRINSSSVHTYIFVCFTLRVILQGFVTQNATNTSGMRTFTASNTVKKCSIKVTSTALATLMHFRKEVPATFFFFKKSYLLLKLITRNEHIRVEQYVQNWHLFHWYLCHNLNHGKEPEIAFQMITRIYYSPFI